MNKHRHRPRRDEGSTYVEILVSIVLIGMVVSAILVTLRTSIGASSLNRDHANAHAWLQSASDLLYGYEREDCGTALLSREAALRDTYEAVARDADNPEGWLDDRLSVVQPVLFWDGDVYQTVCRDDDGLNLQLVTLEVRAPDGRIVESVQVVKG